VPLCGEKLIVRRKQHLLAMINLSIKDEIIPYIFEMDDPKKVWGKLEFLFVAPTPMNRLLIQNQLYMTKVEKRGSVIEYIKKIQDFTKQLHVMGDKIINDDLVMVMLNALSNSYEIFLKSISNHEKFSVTLDKLTTQPHQEKACQKLKGNKKIEEKALMMKFKKMRHNKEQSLRKIKPKLGNCHNCDEPKHWKFECSKLKKKDNKTPIAETKKGDSFKHCPS